MAQYKTPGVYINEVNAFPNSVVEVPTAVPVFIGYTQKAARGKQSLENVPTAVSSLVEFEAMFGGPPQLSVQFDPKRKPEYYLEGDKAFLLYYALRMFFANGGGRCFIVSVGDYTKKIDKDDLIAPFDDALRKELEPTMVVIPDAVRLGAGLNNVNQAALKHCGEMQSRVAILDVQDGWKPIQDKVITKFREGVTDFLKYGSAYYPWLNTSLLDLNDVTLKQLDKKALGNLVAVVKAYVKYLQDNDQKDLAAEIDSEVTKKLTDSKEEVAQLAHQTALVTVAAHGAQPSYREEFQEIVKALNLMPPSAAMAGVYTRVDNSIGVHKAPANTGVFMVVSPSVDISHDQQMDLNVPLNGKAVNAIRKFMGRGVLVWGARTLDGNSQDWRYVNVRRTSIMLEQSMIRALEAYVFAPNTATTWTTVRSMLSNFLDNQWKQGALVGATPAEAYGVSVGLGITMTPDDILEGQMRIDVKVAMSRPSEFILLTFSQKMQTS
ncbi:MAG: phage tail sheath subtilisin-like domain-containing protein [Paracoccaceae bacterium]|nr:phage tail sheath subtilisin-like domain-containing protein [Paracoccaceae bacterium]